MDATIPHRVSVAGARERIDFVDPPEQFGPVPGASVSYVSRSSATGFRAQEWFRIA